MKSSPSTRNSRLRVGTLLAIAVMGAGALTPALLAANVEFGNVGTDLSVNTNWTNNVLPGTTDIALFDSVDTSQLALTLSTTAPSWQGILITTPGGNLSVAAGGTLTVGSSGIDMSGSTVNLTMANLLALSASQTWAVNTGVIYTQSGIVSGAFGINKTGNGSLVLSGANAFTGGLTVSGGITNITAANNMGTGTLTLNGGTLSMAGTAFVAANAVVVNGVNSTIVNGTAGDGFDGSFSGSGTITWLMGGNRIDLGTGNVVPNFTNFTGLLNFANSTTQVRLQGAGSTTTSDMNLGNATVNLGTLTGSMSPRNATSTQSIGALLGGTGTSIGTNSSGTAGATTYALGGKNTNFTFDGTINGAGTAIRKVGTGVMTLTGTNSSYAGAVDIQNGGMAITANAGLGSATATSVLSFGTATTSGTLTANTGSLTTSTRPLTFNGNGTIEVASGSLSLTSTAAIGGTAARTITLSGASGVNTFAPAIANGGGTSLVKSGNSTWVLGNTGSGNSYTGSTVVNAGKLIAGGTLATSGVTVASNAAFDPVNGVGTLQVGNITLAAGSIMDFEFGVGSNDLVNLNSTPLNLGANVTLNLYNAGTNTIFANNGSYQIFSNISSLVGLPSNLVVGDPLSGSTNYSFSQVGTSIYVNITGGNASNTWIFGTPNSVSAYGTSGNWSLNTVPDGAGQSATFLTVLPSGTGTVTLDAARTLGSLVFNNTSASYEIAAGAGGSLVMNNNGGTASITNSAGVHLISAPINFIDPTTITSNGTLTLGGALSGTAATIGAGSGQVVLTSTNSVTTLTVASSAILSVGTGGSLGAGSVVDNGSITLNRSDAYNLDASISGAGTLIQNGTGTVTLTGTNNYTGLTTVHAGKVVVSTGSTGSLTNKIEISPLASDVSTVLVSGGVVNTLQFSIAGSTGNNTDPGTATLIQTGGIINNADWFTVGGGNSGTSTLTNANGTYALNGGTLNVQSANGSAGSNFELANFARATGMVTIDGAASLININNNASLLMGNNNNAGSGTVTQNAGIVQFNTTAAGGTTGGTGTLRIGNAGTLPATSSYVYNLNGGTLTTNQVTRNTAAGNLSSGTFNFNGGTLKVGSTANAATFMSGLTAANVMSGGAIIDNNTISTTIAQGLMDGGGGGGLTKNGAGQLTLSGVSTYTGPTNASAGFLRITGSLTGSGAVNAASSAGIGGTGSIAGAVSIAGGGSLSLQDSTIGTLTLGNNLTLATGGGTTNLRFDLGSTADLVTLNQLTVSAGGTVNFAFNDLGTTAGTYPVVTFNNLNNLGTFDFTPTQAGFLTVTPSLSGNTIVATVSGGTVPANAYWNGSLSTTAWNANTSGNSNFNTDATSGINAQNIPQSASNVIFATTNPAVSAGNLTTSLGQNFSVASIQVQGGLAGLVTINQGTAGTLTIGSGGIAVDNASKGLTIAAPVVVNVAETWTGGNLPASSLTLTGLISGTGSVTLAGIVNVGGTVNNTYTGGTTIVGTVYNSRTTSALENAAFGTGALNAGGGTLIISGTNSATLPIIHMNTGTLTLGNTDAVNQNTNLSNVIDNTSATARLIVAMDNGSSNFTVGGNTAFGGYTGTVQVSGGYLRFTNGTSPVVDPGMSNVSVNLVNNGGLRSRDGGAFALGSLSGDATGFIGGALVSNNPATFSIGAKESSTFSGMVLSGYAANLINPTNLVKVGAATTLTLAGSGTGNSFAGTVSVNAGVLEIASIGNGGIAASGTSNTTFTLVVADATGLAPGMQVVGNSIIPGTPSTANVSGTVPNPSTTISSISGTTITLSQAASATNANIPLLIGTGNALGLSSNAATNVVIDGGTLRYTGPAASTDRLFTVGTNSGNGTLESSGTGPVNFTNTGSIAFGSTSRTLTLGGSNTGNNILSAAINDGASGTTTSLAKTGVGKWVLSGPITSTGSISVSAGKMVLSHTTAARQSAGVLIETSGLSLTGSAQLDITNHDLLIHNATYASVFAKIASGYNFGLWNGPGILTSEADAAGGTTMLGVLQGSDYDNFNAPVFDGRPVVATDVVVKYTYWGDLTLDGQVNGDDLGNFLNFYDGTGGPGVGNYIDGDMNFDGLINGDDLGNFLNNYTAAPAPAPLGGGFGSLGLAAVPEPASLMLLGLGASALLTRRRRKA